MPWVNALSSLSFLKTTTFLSLVCKNYFSYYFFFFTKKKNIHNYNEIILFHLPKQTFVSSHFIRIIGQLIVRYNVGFCFALKRFKLYDSRKCWQNVCTISSLSSTCKFCLRKRYERWSRENMSLSSAVTYLSGV